VLTTALEEAWSGEKGKGGESSHLSTKRPEPKKGDRTRKGKNLKEKNAKRNPPVWHLLKKEGQPAGTSRSKKSPWPHKKKKGDEKKDPKKKQRTRGTRRKKAHTEKTSREEGEEKSSDQLRVNQTERLKKNENGTQDPVSTKKR